VEKMIELKNVNKSFGSKKVINNLDLVIPDGQILAIVGPSGGGKTTLLRTIIFSTCLTIIIQTIF
jgi:polar amino acid transport system ATP-binding protein